MHFVQAQAAHRRKQRAKKQRLLFGVGLVNPCAPKKRGHRLAWPKRAKAEQHTSLGRKRTWWASDAVHFVEQFPDQTSRYIALFRRRHACGFYLDIETAPIGLISDHRTLAAAQAACERHAREAGSC